MAFGMIVSGPIAGLRIYKNTQDIFKDVSTYFSIEISTYAWSSLISAVCSLVDLILALFPTSMFWNLKMEFKQKLYLSCIMGLGIV